MTAEERDKYLEELEKYHEESKRQHRSVERLLAEPHPSPSVTSTDPDDDA